MVTHGPVRPGRVGRDGFLSLSFERRSGAASKVSGGAGVGCEGSVTSKVSEGVGVGCEGSVTVLGGQRFTLPLQVTGPTRLDGSGSLCMMLLNPTGGVAGGDRLKTEIMLGPGAHVVLTTPSATRIYRSQGEPAIYDTNIHISRDAVLEYLPDHVIPHPGSVFHQSLTMDMEPGSLAFLVDSLAVGRLARGERWMFNEMVSRTTISLEGRPFFVDRTSLNPDNRTLAGLGGMEDFGYMATLVMCGDGYERWQNLAGTVSDWLNDRPSVLGGISPLSRNGYMVRLLTTAGYELTEAIQGLWAIARRILLGLPALDLRKR